MAAALFWGPLASTRALAQEEPIPQPEGDADVSTFDETLAPYGQWVETGDGPDDGRAWRPDPDVVGEEFQPYATGGHWVYSDWGWTWESDYPWGWAPFHYGRWALTPSWGWVWYPGTVWAPAWVDWRFGGGYIGWAPLPPVGFAVVVQPWRPYWCFVPSNVFVYRDVWAYRLPVDRIHSAYAATVPVHQAVSYGRARWYAGPPRAPGGARARPAGAPGDGLHPAGAGSGAAGPSRVPARPRDARPASGPAVSRRERGAPLLAVPGRGGAGTGRWLPGPGRAESVPWGAVARVPAWPLPGRCRPVRLRPARRPRARARSDTGCPSRARPTRSRASAHPAELRRRAEQLGHGSAELRRAERRRVRGAVAAQLLRTHRVAQLLGVPRPPAASPLRRRAAVAVAGSAAMSAAVVPGVVTPAVAGAVTRAAAAAAASGPVGPRQQPEVQP